jgi:preprotein translocase subunit YajC
VSFVIIMVLLLVVMYVLMIRPQRQRQAEQQKTIDIAGVGDDILTTGGIYGTITKTDGDDIVVELTEGVSVHMTRRGIAAVLPPEDEAGDEGEEEEGTEDPHAESQDVVEGEAAEVAEHDEGAVAVGEEPVRSEGGADATAEQRL